MKTILPLYRSPAQSIEENSFSLQEFSDESGYSFDSSLHDAS
jgi:hypothetical protein